MILPLLKTEVSGKVSIQIISNYSAWVICLVFPISVFIQSFAYICINLCMFILYFGL